MSVYEFGECVSCGQSLPLKDRKCFKCGLDALARFTDVFSDIFKTGAIDENNNRKEKS